MPGNSKLQCYSAPALYTKQCEHPEVQLGGGPRPWARNAGGGCEGGRTRIVGPGPLPQTKTVTGAVAVRGGLANTNQMSKKCVWVVFAEAHNKYTKDVLTMSWVLWFPISEQHASLTMT